MFTHSGDFFFRLSLGYTLGLESPNTDLPYDNLMTEEEALTFTKCNKTKDVTNPNTSRFELKGKFEEWQSIYCFVYTWFYTNICIKITSVLCSQSLLFDGMFIWRRLASCLMDCWFEDVQSAVNWDVGLKTFSQMFTGILIWRRLVSCLTDCWFQDVQSAV